MEHLGHALPLDRLILKDKFNHPLKHHVHRGKPSRFVRTASADSIIFASATTRFLGIATRLHCGRLIGQWGSGIRRCVYSIVHQILSSLHNRISIPSIYHFYYTSFRRVQVGYNFHTRRPRNAHANTHTPKAYADKTPIARPSEANIVRIDMFTTPVATLACRSKTYVIITNDDERGGEVTRTRRKTASAFRLIASSSGGAGIGLGSEVVIAVVAR